MALNGFVRQLATLAVLWALCELLKCNQRQQQMVRLAVSLMVMVALIASLGKVLGTVKQTEWPVFSPAEEVQTARGYQRIALTSLANQVEQYCLRMARNAGYEAQCAVFLQRDGSVKEIRLHLSPEEAPPVMEETMLVAALAQQLSVPEEKISWQPLWEEAIP